MLIERKTQNQIFIELENLNEIFVFYFMLKFSKVETKVITKESVVMKSDFIDRFETIFDNISVIDVVKNLKNLNNLKK